MTRITGPLLACALALANTPANAQAGATPAPPEDRDASTAGEPRGGSAQVPTADDICRALEQSAAENALPVEFFARVIWQESRFDARTVSPTGAAGIAQFMPATSSLREPLNRFGNLGLAAAAYNAGPARVARAVVAAFGDLLARTAEPVWQSWTCRSGVQCRSSSGGSSEVAGRSFWRHKDLRTLPRQACERPGSHSTICCQQSKLQPLARKRRIQYQDSL